MISRRTLMGCGVAAASIGAAGCLAGAFENPARPGSHLALLIVDERFDVARRWASLAAPGAPRVALPRDVLDLWQRKLLPLVQSGRPMIGGITTERGFFVLQTLGADHRLRVLSSGVVAARHAAEESVISWVLGPNPGRT